MKVKGFSLLELLVVVGIVAILAAQLFPIIGQAKRRAKAVTDVTNMRGLHAAVCLYESDHDDAPPALLPLVERYAASQAIYASVLDPRPPSATKPGWNPAPCGPPTDAPRPGYRLSYAYLLASMPESAASGDRWDYGYWRQTPTAGMLASPWVGDVVEWMRDDNDASEHGPVMKGAVYRLNMDGSLYVLPRRRYEDCLGGCTFDLFFNRG